MSPTRVIWVWTVGAAAVVLLSAATASAGDYARNDVSGRELGLTFGRVAAGEAPVGGTIRGVARRHNRFFYMATELELGVTGRPGFYTAVGGAVGVESSTDAFTRLRGYGQIGASLQWSHSDFFEMLLVHVEVGVRVQLQTNTRPHMYLFLGSRVCANFRDYGVGLNSGIGWTFD